MARTRQCARRAGANQNDTMESGPDYNRNTGDVYGGGENIPSGDKGVARGYARDTSVEQATLPLDTISNIAMTHSHSGIDILSATSWDGSVMIWQVYEINLSAFLCFFL
jgi:hypothetical protein